ncbi:DNA polymerase IV [[Eubacterium] cellulosolvens]
MKRIILHVDLDSFYASLEEIRHTELKGKPIVICVYSGRSSDSGAVSTSNYKARELGIKSGIPISLAKHIAKDKEVIFLPVDMEYYRLVSDRIMELLEEEADTIEQVSIDEAYLDVTNRTYRNWIEAQKIAEKIKGKIKNYEGLTCSVGIGPNKLVAKMASGHKKPNGLTIITDAEVIDFFEKLPVSKIHGIGDKTTKSLNELGIQIASDLTNYNIDVLERIFGKNKAKILHDKSKGIDESPVEQGERKQISRIGTLSEDTDNIEIIFEKIKELSIDIQKKIKKNAVDFRTISIIAIDTKLKIYSRSETLQQTHLINENLFVVRNLLQKFFEENPERKLRRIGIKVSNFVEKKKQKTLGEFYT